MQFGFQASRGPCCKLLSVGFLACVGGLIERRGIFDVASGLTIEFGWGALVDFYQAVGGACNNAKE